MLLVRYFTYSISLIRPMTGKRFLPPYRLLSRSVYISSESEKLFLVLWHGIFHFSPPPLTFDVKKQKQNKTTTTQTPNSQMSQPRGGEMV